MGSYIGILHYYTLISLFINSLNLIIIISAEEVIDDTGDGAVIKELASLLSPRPLSWTTGSDYCAWDGVSCHINNDTRARDILIIDLAFMSLSGTLPRSLNSLSQLTRLSLQNNHLTGPLPTLANLTFLEEIHLHSNNFTSIPIGCFSGLTSLQILSLSDNVNLAPWGFPSELSRSSSNLVTLNASSVNMMGFIPDMFSSFPILQTLVLSYNNFTGLLPASFSGSVIRNMWLNGQESCLYGPIDVLSRMTQLSQVWLQSNLFTGPIPDLSLCTLLFDLQLRDNRLTGPIPESLTGLAYLRGLDVSNNNLSGQIPHFRPDVVILDAGNNFRSSEQFWKTWKVVLVVLVPIIMSVILFSTLLNEYKKRMRKKISDEVKQWGDHSLLAPDLPVRFSYEVLKVATSNFDMNRKLGSGGFGSVFEGILSDGSKIAAKRLDRLGQGRKEFLAEVNTIGSIHHINLVKLIGFCVENTHRILVYEHMSNGSLDKWIFRNDLRPSLAWDTRKKIILHIAKGLAYLHEECQRKIAHLDIKPQNVLLDDSFNAKLSDFGLAKLIDRDQSFVMTQMRGTRGYLAPEWLGRKITEKVDVYSYGVVVLEVIFGRKNLDFSPPQESDNLLVNIVRKKAEASRLDELLESCSEDVQENGEEVLNIIKLATWCLHSDPGRRPSMSRVIKILEGEINMDFAAIDCSYLFPEMDGTSTLDATTQISACVLSGPR